MVLVEDLTGAALREGNVAWVQLYLHKHATSLSVAGAAASCLKCCCCSYSQVQCQAVTAVNSESHVMSRMKSGIGKGEGGQIPRQCHHGRTHEAQQPSNALLFSDPPNAGSQCQNITVTLPNDTILLYLVT